MEVLHVYLQSNRVFNAFCSQVCLEANTFIGKGLSIHNLLEPCSFISRRGHYAEMAALFAALVNLDIGAELGILGVLSYPVPMSESIFKPKVAWLATLIHVGTGYFCGYNLQLEVIYPHLPGAP